MKIELCPACTQKIIDTLAAMPAPGGPCETDPPSNQAGPTPQQIAAEPAPEAKTE